MTYDYERTASGPMSSNDFAAALKRANIGEGQLFIRQTSIGSSESMFVNFINISEAIGGKSGADAENNRTLFRISGFDAKDLAAPAAKVKLEITMSMLPRSEHFRARSGKPDSIAKFLVAYMERIAREVEPTLPIHLR